MNMKNFEGKAIQNDIIDEVYELEEGEEMIEERKILNQPVDEEVPFSDNSENSIPTPPDEPIKEPSHPIPQFRNSSSPYRKSEFDDARDSQDQKRLESALKRLRSESSVMEIFNYISAFTPQTLELEVKLKPFVPDLVPAVGEVDAFLKIPRPDGRDEILGLERIDE